MYFEIDENGKPFWICPVTEHQAGIFGARTVKGVILVDACSGAMEYVDVTEVPQWVDRVYDGDLLCGYYDSYGTLQSGFWNSVFGNKNCTVTTEDYGYKIIDDDVWVYTGVTSVSSDESNIGFLLMNQRTMKTYYFSCAGAEEFSAMSAAEGMVQDLGYKAAFPSIINVSGIPTYLMCLKDGSGLVKMYALVNVEQYNLVGTGVTQAEALKSYRTVLSQNKIEISGSAQGEAKTAEITVSEVQFIQSDGETIVYIKAESGECYKMNFRDCEELIFLEAGDMLKVSYNETEGSRICQLIAFEVEGRK
jgi:translation elongation factor P/translation initiation factor 5A